VAAAPDVSYWLWFLLPMQILLGWGLLRRRGRRRFLDLEGDRE
jgi:hypothetical protein